MLEKVKEALKQAIVQVEEHNKDYHHTTSVDLISQWKSLVYQPRTMSDPDRSELIRIIHEQYCESHWDDRRESVEELNDATLDGMEGLNDWTDTELLDDAASNYVNVAGELLGDPGEDWNPTEDEVFRIWAKYRKPEILCKSCAGTGKVESIDCPNCLASGLSDTLFSKSEGTSK